MSPAPVSALTALTGAAAISAAAVGGLFFAFSTFVMRGLDRTGPAAATTAMRGINADAQANAAFLVLFFGSAALALGVGVVAAVQIRQPGSGYLLVGAALSLLAMVVTVVANVPLNDQLDVTRDWRHYVTVWTAWNHVRTIAPLLGSVLMLVGLSRR